MSCTIWLWFMLHFFLLVFLLCSLPVNFTSRLDASLSRMAVTSNQGYVFLLHIQKSEFPAFHTISSKHSKVHFDLPILVFWTGSNRPSLVLSYDYIRFTGDRSDIRGPNNIWECGFFPSPCPYSAARDSAAVLLQVRFLRHDPEASAQYHPSLQGTHTKP